MTPFDRIVPYSMCTPQADNVQVHKAKLRSESGEGQIVAVKVQYRNAEQEFTQDFTTVRQLAGLMSRTELAFDMKSAADEVISQVHAELDFCRCASFCFLHGIHAYAFRHTVSFKLVDLDCTKGYLCLKVQVHVIGVQGSRGDGLGAQPSEVHAWASGGATQCPRPGHKACHCDGLSPGYPSDTTSGVHREHASADEGCCVQEGVLLQ